MTRNITLFAAIAVAALLCASAATAQDWGFHYSSGGSSGYYHSGGSHYGGSHYGGHRSYSRGHYDYHPGGYQRHGNHYDYVPGHYDYHPTPRRSYRRSYYGHGCR